MEELLAVFLLLCWRLYCVEKDVVEKVVELLLDLKVTHDLLREAVIHSVDVINDLYRCYGKAKYCLRKQFPTLCTLRRFEGLVPCEQDCSDHLSNTEKFGIL